MKKILLSLFFAGSFFATAQNQNSVSFNIGAVSKNTIGYNVNYWYTSNNSNYEVGVLHSTFNENATESVKINFNSTVLQLGYFHNLVRSKDNSIVCALGGGAFGGYESVPTNNLVVLNSKSGAIAGVYVGGQLDFYVSDNFGFDLRLQENYNVKSTTGTLSPFIGAGLKFNF